MTADRRTGWRLSPSQRKATLVLHILSGIGWMGADIALLALLLTGLTTDDGAVAAGCYIAVGVIVPLAVPALALGMLGTGLLLGWGTKWGLLRYWWVFVKLIIGVVLNVLVFVALLPGIDELQRPDAALSADAVREIVGDATTQLLFPPIVSFAMLGISMVLSIFKPWGRTRWTPPPPAAGRNRSAAASGTGQ